MAGDWIPTRKGLINELEVLRVAAEVGMSVYTVVGILAHFWGWADDVTEDGRLPGISVPFLSQVCPGVDGTFWRALVRAGWLVVNDDGLEIPNYERWLNNAAKKRLKETQRKRNYRNGKRNVPDVSQSKRDTPGTKAGPQDRTGQKSKTPTLPSPLNTPAFAKLWERWCAYRREIRKTLKPSTAAEQLAKLAAWGEAKAIRALEDAICYGWRSFHEPKDEPGRAVGSDLQPRPSPGKYAHLGPPGKAGPAPSAPAPLAHPQDQDPGGDSGRTKGSDPGACAG